MSKTIFGDGSQIIQFANEQSRTLFQTNGSLNTDPTTRLPQATPLSMLDSTSSHEDIYLFGGNGPFVQTLRALPTSGYSVTLLYSGLALRVEADAADPSLSDEITLDPQASHLGFHIGAAGKALRAQLLTATSDGNVHSAIIAGSSFSFDPARQALTTSRAALLPSALSRWKEPHITASHRPLSRPHCTWKMTTGQV